jgi:dolichol-phosphate mannosyltransferase
MSPKSRKQLLTPWPWLGILISVLFLAPVLTWNLNHDWPSFKFQFRDRHQGGGFDPKRWLGYLGTQIGLLSPGVYVATIFTFVTAAFRLKDPRWRLLFCLALPGFLLFYPQPLWADYKPHWMGPFYFILILGLGSVWAEGLSLFDKQLVNPFSAKMKWAIAGFLIPMNLLMRLRHIKGLFNPNPRYPRPAPGDLSSFPHINPYVTRPPRHRGLCLLVK